MNSNKKNSEKKIKNEYSWFYKTTELILPAIILGFAGGLVSILFNFLLIFFKFLFSNIFIFITPIIAGLITSISIKVGGFEEITGPGASKFVIDINNPETSHLPYRTFLSKSIATSITLGSGFEPLLNPISRSKNN